MSEEDFKECPFIYEELRFYLYDDFIANCEILRHLYNNYLGVKGKIFYKWYVYANIDLTLNQKNVVWDYLNGYCDKIELLKLRK